MARANTVARDRAINMARTNTVDTVRPNTGQG